MKVVMSLIVAGLISSSAWAQSSLSDPAGADPSSADQAISSQPPSAQNSGLVNLPDLKGATVKNSSGDTLGQIDQILADPQTGRIRYGVLDANRDWNWSDSKIAVPWSSFQIQNQGNNNVQLTLDATKDKLFNAPKFHVGDADRLYSKSQSDPIYSYWTITWIDELPPVAEKLSGTSKKSKTSGTSTVTPSPVPTVSLTPSPSPTSTVVPSPTTTVTPMESPTVAPEISPTTTPVLSPTTSP